MPDTAYLDASAIVKLALQEAETPALEADVIWRDGLVSSRLGAAEAYRAARRAGPERAVQQVEEAIESLYLCDITAKVCDRAAKIIPATLKISDAIHLATALAVAEPGFVFITYDTRLARAAEENGLKVVQPGRQG